MERRHFLGLAFGLVAGTALAASAKAAPLLPQPLGGNGQLPAVNKNAHSAVTSAEEVDQLKPEEVHWGHHWHRGWHHRHWGWHHRHWGWRRRHWGWHHHHWHHHHWRRRYW